MTYNCNKNKAAVTTIISFDLDLPPADFLSCVHATVSVNSATTDLGWCICDDKKKDIKSLSIIADVERVFKAHRKLTNNLRRQKAVYMEAINLVCFEILIFCYY